MKKIFGFAAKYLYATLSCLYLFTIGYFFKRNRDLISFIELSGITPDDIPVRVHFFAIPKGKIS
ncbi:MAG: hypothetical protein ACE5JK_05445 [Candidatus Omnitrophota bacterium]